MKRLLDRGAMNRTPVKQHKLVEPVAPSLPGSRKKTCEPESLPFEEIDFSEPGQMGVSEQIPDAHCQALSTGKRGSRASAASPFEGHRGFANAIP
jgi:hypothetical protein